MNKKKIIAVALCVCMAATAIVGGTLAYFTDTDTKTNTFTTAKVDITLNEKQRNSDSTALEDFKNEKVLLPIVGSAQGEKETVGGVAGLPKATNYVDKIMTITNNEIDAYVRLYVAIPEVLDNVADAGQNILHFNTTKESDAEGQWGEEVLVAKSVKIGDVKYNVYYRTYNTALTKAATTSTPAYVGFYMDQNVDCNDNGKYTITRNGTTTEIDFDFSKGVSIPVYAVGVQSAGFTGADTAIESAFGANFNPWATATAAE